MQDPARSRHWRVDHETRSTRGARYERDVRDCYKATALSTVLPAAGLFRVRPALASTIVLVFLAPLVYLGFRFVRDGALGSVLDIGVDRGKLLVVVGTVVVLGLAWIVGIVATAHGTRPAHMRRADRIMVTLFTAAMTLVIAAPTVIAVQGIDIQRDTLAQVVTDSTRPPMVVEDKDPWESRPRVNLLLLGSDAGADREGTRPDTIMVASIDTATGDTVFIGLPRNLQRVPFPRGNPLRELFPDGYDCGSECLLNSVWTLAEERSDLFPGDPSPGLTTTRDVVSEVTGLTVDDTILVDLSGFEQLVDAMGGVTINAIERVPIGGKVENGQIVGIKGWIEPGLQHMDGYHALWYARSRATTDDFSRMRRQRCVMGAIVDQVDPVRMLARYPQLARAIADNVSVDIPADDLGAWAELVLRMKDGRLQSLPVTNQVVDVSDPDFPLIRSLVREAITNPPTPSTPPTTATPTTPTSSSTDDATTDPDETPTSSPPAEPTDELADLGATC
ncbi:MAG: LCP family protein [Dermatophilaceae bacterium]|nr:LCP family protein [Intrasporangiaceae bacterium]